MKSSDFMDKRISELSRSHSDDFSDLSYSRGREPEEDDDLSYGLTKDDLSSTFHFRPVRPVVSPDSYDSPFQVCLIDRSMSILIFLDIGSMKNLVFLC